MVESWTGGMNWVSQWIKDAKLLHELNDVNINAVATTISTDMEMNRLDFDGLPSSF